MSGKILKTAVLTTIFLVFGTFLFSYSTVKPEFLAVGNIKIVRPEPLVIKREDLNITIEKNGKIKVENLYTFENMGNFNVKSTFMFWLDQNTVNKETGKYIENIRFFSDFKKSENLRAVINFSENIYDNQNSDNIQREWFAISKTIESEKTGKLGVYYNLINTQFEKNRKVNFSFELVDNFSDKNKVEIFYVNIYNKSHMKIDTVTYKNYTFKNMTRNSQKEHYELLVGNVNLDGKLTINFK